MHTWLEELDCNGNILRYIDPTFIQFSKNDDLSFKIWIELPSVYHKEEIDDIPIPFIKCKNDSEDDLDKFLRLIADSSAREIKIWKK
jgi:hypothetical protein